MGDGKGRLMAPVFSKLGSWQANPVACCWIPDVALGKAGTLPEIRALGSSESHQEQKAEVGGDTMGEDP